MIFTLPQNFCEIKTNVLVEMLTSIDIYVHVYCILHLHVSFNLTQILGQAKNQNA